MDFQWILYLIFEYLTLITLYNVNHYNTDVDGIEVHEKVWTQYFDNIEAFRRRLGN